MLNTPRTEKISENPRKYHFAPSQSIFVLRNSSTLLNPQRTLQDSAISQNSKLDRQRSAAFLLLQVRIEDHARHKHGGKQVRQQTKHQRQCKSAHRTRTEQKQNRRRNNRRDVGIDN